MQCFKRDSLKSLWIISTHTQKNLKTGISLQRSDLRICMHYQIEKNEKPAGHFMHFKKRKTGCPVQYVSK